MTLYGVAADVKSNTTELQNSEAAIQTSLTEAESRISNLANDNGKLFKKVEQLWTWIDKLIDHVNNIMLPTNPGRGLLAPCPSPVLNAP